MITVKDIARITEVFQSTVSPALKNRHDMGITSKIKSRITVYPFGFAKKRSQKTMVRKFPVYALPFFTSTIRKWKGEAKRFEVIGAILLKNSIS